MKKKILMLVGNYGVGKSTLIKNKILAKYNDIFLQISKRWWVLGTNICGADSVSNFNKDDVMKKIEKARLKGIIITGNYYCTNSDVERLRKNNDVSIVYLHTNFNNNAKRIAQRGGIINPTTYNQKLTSHLNLLKNQKDFVKIRILDNNRGPELVRKDFEKLLNEL